MSPFCCATTSPAGRLDGRATALWQRGLAIAVGRTASPRRHALAGSGAGSVPKKASRVWPSAPPSVRIAAEARRLPESDKSMGYGILCRVSGNDAYVLTINNGYATIEKWGNYAELRKAETQVDLYSTNELQAVCAGDKRRAGSPARALGKRREGRRGDRHRRAAADRRRRPGCDDLPNDACERGGVRQLRRRAGGLSAEERGDARPADAAVRLRPGSDLADPEAGR